MKFSARNTALNFLSRREHGVEELRRKLSEKEFPPHEIEAALESLQADNLLNEKRFIESYINTRCRKGFGPVAINYELKMKGVDENLVRMVLQSLDIDWLNVLETVVNKKYGNHSVSVHADAIKKAKCWRFLKQRGFTTELISELFSAQDV